MDICPTWTNTFNYEQGSWKFGTIILAHLFRQEGVFDRDVESHCVLLCFGHSV